MLISLLMAGLVLALLVLAAAARIWTSVLPMRVKVPLATYRASPVAPLTDSTAPRTPARAMVVLGSGGHTTEMLALIRRLDRAHYAPITFVVAATDATSEEKTRIDWRPRDGVDSFVVIPRSREVGQSWSSSVWTTLRAFVTCVSTVYTHQPHVVLCNGPGTCIPIVAAVLLFRFLGLSQARGGRAKVVFCESFARVRSLSLSGRLLYCVADEFVVHWPQLQTQYPRTRHLGVIC